MTRFSPREDLQKVGAGCRGADACRALTYVLAAGRQGRSSAVSCVINVLLLHLSNTHPPPGPSVPQPAQRTDICGGTAPPGKAQAEIWWGRWDTFLLQTRARGRMAEKWNRLL